MGKFNTYTQVNTLDATDIFLISKNGTGTRYIDKTDLASEIGGSNLWQVGGGGQVELVSTAITSFQVPTTASGAEISNWKDSVGTKMLTFDDRGFINQGGFKNIRFVGATESSRNWFFAGAGNLTLSGTFNLGIGQSAGVALTSANNLVAIGANAGDSVTSGASNTYIGVSAGATNSTAAFQTCIGASAGQNTTGEGNIVIGANAALGLTSGTHCVIAGYNSVATTNVSTSVLLGHNVFNSGTCVNTVALGQSSGFSASSSNSIFLGGKSGYYETNSGRFIATNQQGSDQATAQAAALLYGTMDATTANQVLQINAKVQINGFDGVLEVGATESTSSWFLAGAGNTTVTGANNYGIGYQTLDSLTTGFHNIAIGDNALTTISTGQHCIAIGENAGNGMTSNVHSIAIGNESLATANNPQYSVAIGYMAGDAGGSNDSVLLGKYAGTKVTTASKFVVTNQQANTSEATHLAAALIHGTMNATTTSQTLDINAQTTVNSDYFNISTSKTPSSAADTGTTGQVAWDTGFIYICTATNTWKRVAIATW